MRYALKLTTALAWALWLGGLIALFLFVSTMFKQDRPTAVVAAPMLFNAFEKYELVLAIVGVASATFLFAATRSRLPLALAGLMAVAGVAGLASSLTVTAKMNALRAAGQSASPEFRKLHGYSSMVYVGQAALLTAGGLLLPSIMNASSRQERRDEPTAA